MKIVGVSPMEFAELGARKLWAIHSCDVLLLPFDQGCVDVPTLIVDRSKLPMLERLENRRILRGIREEFLVRCSWVYRRIVQIIRRSRPDLAKYSSWNPKNLHYQAQDLARVMRCQRIRCTIYLRLSPRF